MNENEAILAELRKISAWMSFQRKMTKWSLILFGMLLLAAPLFGLLLDHEVKTNIEPDFDLSWYDVDRNVLNGNSEKAIKLGEELIVKSAQVPEAHRHLANAYMAAGKLDKAREHYAEAFRLFPSEENEKLLAAIDKRIKAENPKP